MNGKLLKCKIDVNKIDPERLFKGEKGNWLNLSIWINEESDKFGNDCSIQQDVKKGEDKIYIGSGKWYKPKESEGTAPVPEFLNNKEGVWQGEKDVEKKIKAGEYGTLDADPDF